MSESLENRYYLWCVVCVNIKSKNHVTVFTLDTTAGEHEHDRVVTGWFLVKFGLVDEAIS